ncbi:hypothetical protein FRC03_004308, partial [Tulasnella sp. 419]
MVTNVCSIPLLLVTILNEPPRFAAEPGVGSLPSCSDPTLRANIEKAQYQYLVIGAGAGGGTVAARLADDGYTVCLIEAGKASLPYRDVWSLWGPAQFIGYYTGWGEDARKVKNAIVNVILKAHTAAQGWVRLTSPDPQAPLDITRMNSLHEGWHEVCQEMGRRNAFLHSACPEYPMATFQCCYRPRLQKLYQRQFWGHHACCTNKIILWFKEPPDCGSFELANDPWYVRDD